MARMHKIQRINTPNRILNMIQDNIANIVEPIASSPILDNVILEKVSLKTGSNSVVHKLNRKVIGWFIIRQRSAGTVYDTQDTNPDPQIYLRLTASANIVVDLYIF